MAELSVKFELPNFAECSAGRGQAFSDFIGFNGLYESVKRDQGLFRPDVGINFTIS